ncbi:hypothetical protein [Bradyrhizobium sp. AZCC 2289]|uniref:hypothetical protein n=1 Tax=Bradyrhizobium sp. AZCC 2289 TaxID=3117026 RepID=UPI0030381877
MLVLLLLDPGQHFAETLVLDDGGRSARGSQIPACRIQPRNVSRDTRRSWRSASFSAANVGPKSA